jgi:hypothetical protein
MNKKSRKEFVITKKIAKHGSQSIIVIPRILESQLSPGTITKLTIEVLEDNVNIKEGRRE